MCKLPTDDLEILIDEAARLSDRPRKAVRVCFSPYRVSPLGAHVDHQLGQVTGLALDRGIWLAFTETDDGSVTLLSKDFEGRVSFNLNNTGEMPEGWGRYAVGAVRALNSAGY